MMWCPQQRDASGRRSSIATAMACCMRSAFRRFVANAGAPARRKEVRTTQMSMTQSPSPTEQCLEWNRDPAHQRMAGQARSRQFTRDYQTQAGHCCFAAFSARWRAGQGLAPLSVEAAQGYVTIDHIRGPLGQVVPPALRAEVYAARCTGYLVSVATWLQTSNPGAPPE